MYVFGIYMLKKIRVGVCRIFFKKLFLSFFFFYTKTKWNTEAKSNLGLGLQVSDYFLENVCGEKIFL